jgi:hypothetical protein
MDVVEGQRELWVTSSGELRLRALTFNMELEAGYVGLVDQDGGVTLRQGKDLDGTTSLNNIFSGTAMSSIDTKFQLNKISALGGSVINSGQYLRIENGVLSIEGMLRSSLKDLVVGDNAIMILSATAFTESLKSNLFSMDTLTVVEGGNLTLSPHAVIQANDVVIGDSSGSTSKIILNLVATLTIQNKLEIKKMGKIEGKGRGLPACSDIQNSVGPQSTVFDKSCDELRFLNLTNFNTRKHGQMIELKSMGGTHAGVGGSKYGFMSEEPGQTQYHFGKWGDSLCYGINEQQEALICGGGVDVNTICNCTLMGYGSYQNPIYPGSGGASSSGGENGGKEFFGAGGAAIHIAADTVIVNGVVDMSGQQGADHSSPGGGGGGGSIWIETDDFQGAGKLLTNGGRGGVGQKVNNGLPWSVTG